MTWKKRGFYTIHVERLSEEEEGPDLRAENIPDMSKRMRMDLMLLLKGQE
jgi:hypothetical protein